MKTYFYLLLSFVLLFVGACNSVPTMPTPDIDQQPDLTKDEAVITPREEIADSEVLLPPARSSIEQQRHDDMVTAVIEEVGTFDINDRNTFPTPVEVGAAVAKVMNLTERSGDVNDPNCAPELKAPFPIYIRGTFMSALEQYNYFAGHITLAMVGTFEELWPDGPTGADVFWVFWDVFKIYNEMIPGDVWVGYMTDVQETNRFGSYCLHVPNCLGQCGYNVPELWGYDECPMVVPTER